MTSYVLNNAGCKPGNRSFDHEFCVVYEVPELSDCFVFINAVADRTMGACTQSSKVQYKIDREDRKSHDFRI
jgi:hypothetical protein